MKSTVCHAPGCYAAALPGLRYCERHKALESKAKAFANAKRTKSAAWHDLYHTAQWRKTSREFLKANPYCVRCGAPARISDHIIPHRGDLSLFYDKGNLQALCWSCHSAKTLRENGGFKDRRPPLGFKT